jgi:hypothetical protein
MTEPLDEFDRSLHDRIGAAEARVQVSSTPPDGRSAEPVASRWLRPALVMGTAAVAVVLAVLVIGQLPNRPFGGATPSPTNPYTAQTRDGDFVLTVSVPRATWVEGESIPISSTLSYFGDGELALWGTGTSVTFEARQISGGDDHRFAPEHLPCVGPQPIQHGTPVVRDYALPREGEPPLAPGRWEITATSQFTVGGCGGDGHLLSVTIAIDIEPNGVSASARNGDFVLTLYSPRSTWTTEDAIEITATLNYDGDEPEVEIGGGGGPIVFSLVQLEGGNAVLGGGQDLPCLRYQLGPNAPLVWPFQKAGGVDEEPPFDRAFFDDPELHLPPGRWEVRAVLEYGDQDCGDWQQLVVSVTLDVLEAEGPPGPSAVATDPPVSSAPAVPASSAPSPTLDGIPASVTGILDGDPQLEGGCVWLRDQAGTVWEVNWPKGYEATFRDGSAVLVSDGEVVATAGDRITVYGSRPSGAGSHCQVGIVYEAKSVLIR